MNTVKINHRDVKMVAHRGVSGLEKENTHAAFIAAGNRSYWGVETDVHLTKDGKYIIIHDDNTERVTGVSLCVEETDFQTLREMTLLDTEGNPGATYLKMPTLEEYINVCKKYEKNCVLELKNHMPEENVKEIAEIIESLGWLDRVIFISFDFENLVSLRKYYPNQTVQFLFRTLTDEIFEKVVKHGFDVDVDCRHLTEEQVQKYHSAGIKVNSWTVNDPLLGADLVRWGVDYITSNILE